MKIIHQMNNSSSSGNLFEQHNDVFLRVFAKEFRKRLLKTFV